MISKKELAQKLKDLLDIILKNNKNSDFIEVISNHGFNFMYYSHMLLRPQQDEVGIKKVNDFFDFLAGENTKITAFYDLYIKSLEDLDALNINIYREGCITEALENGTIIDAPFFERILSKKENDYCRKLCEEFEPENILDTIGVLHSYISKFFDMKLRLFLKINTSFIGRNILGEIISDVESYNKNKKLIEFFTQQAKETLDRLGVKPLKEYKFIFVPFDELSYKNYKPPNFVDTPDSG
jgi:hypothetical protein